MIHDGKPYDPIQGQGQRCPKFPKMVDSESVSSTGMHVIKGLMVNYDAPGCLNSNQTDF